jgi:hypothetical protein
LTRALDLDKSFSTKHKLGKIKDADTFMFPSGYFSRLFVAVVSLFSDLFESVDVFEGAMDLRFTKSIKGDKEKERVQVIIRNYGDFFYVVVVSVKGSKGSSPSTAWQYYLKIATLFNRTSNMLTKESKSFHWHHENILVEEVCFNPDKKSY